MRRNNRRLTNPGIRADDDCRRRRSIEMASQVAKTPVARIGAVSRGAGVRLINADGAPIEIDPGGLVVSQFEI